MQKSAAPPKKTPCVIFVELEMMLAPKDSKIESSSLAGSNIITTKCTAKEDPPSSVLLSTPFTKMPLVVVSRTRHCTCKLDGIRHENLITKMTGLNLIKSSCCKNLDICEHPLEVPESNHNESDECSQVLFSMRSGDSFIQPHFGRTMIPSFNLSYTTDEMPRAQHSFFFRWTLKLPTFSPVGVTLCVWRWYLLCTEDRSKPQRKKFNDLIRLKMQLFAVTSYDYLSHGSETLINSSDRSTWTKMLLKKNARPTWYRWFDPWTEKTGWLDSYSSFYLIPRVFVSHPGGQQHGPSRLSS